MGNLAWSLIPALQQVPDFSVNQIVSRDVQSLTHFAKVYQIPHCSTELSDISPDINVVSLALPDHVIAETAMELSHTKAVIIHHSGATSLGAITNFSTFAGVIYPLQSFTKEKVVPMNEIPVFWESTSESTDIVSHIAHQLSSHVQRLDSQQRLKIHAGAVWVNNFTNMMYRVAEELVVHPNVVDFEVYQPLIYEHISKIFSNTPTRSQTGPAMRGDIHTLLNHLKLLEERPELQTVYKQISELINPKLKNKWP